MAGQVRSADRARAPTSSEAPRITASALVETRPDALIETRPERAQTIGRFPDMIGVGTHRRLAQFRLAPLDVRSISQS
jgi:hypothetical protein